MMISTTQNSQEDNQRRGGENHPSQAAGWLRKTGEALAVFLFWVICWQLLSLVVGQELLLASPLSVGRCLLRLLGESSFYGMILGSMGRIMMGFLLALVVGILLATLTCFLPLMERLLAPLMGIIKATPVASFIILALVWLKSSGAVTFSAFLMVLPIVWTNLSQGIRSADPQLLEMGRMYQFSRLKKIKYLYVPAMLPYFVAAVSTGLGFAWKSGVAAEVLGTPDGSIGKALNNAKIYLETPDLFAWTIVVILLSIFIEKMMLWLIRKVINQI